MISWLSGKIIHKGGSFIILNVGGVGYKVKISAKTFFDLEKRDEAELFTYQNVHEEQNASRLGYGLCITKFTGHGGKYGANDADAEYIGWLRRIFNKNKVVWQTGELGKVDEGGGGTVAKFLAVYGMDIVDCGPPVLSMHSPFEVAHKGDLYMSYKGFRSFYESGPTF